MRSSASNLDRKLTTPGNSATIGPKWICTDTTQSVPDTRHCLHSRGAPTWMARHDCGATVIKSSIPCKPVKNRQHLASLHRGLTLWKRTARLNISTPLGSMNSVAPSRSDTMEKISVCMERHTWFSERTQPPSFSSKLHPLYSRRLQHTDTETVSSRPERRPAALRRNAHINSSRT
jgi:hypothetical protein